MRARLVAQIAGQVAAGYAANPETSGEPPARIARWSVDLAEQIVAEVEERARAEEQDS